MDIENRLREYFSDIRDEVCSRCSGRPVGDPRGNPCGTTLPVEQLVGALLVAHGGQVPRLPSSERCPCSDQKLAALAAEAAEALSKKAWLREHLFDLWGED